MKPPEKTPEWYAAKRKEYVAKLAKAGSKKDTKEAREACADAIISRLASAYPRGVRSQNAALIQERFRGAVRRAREGIDALREAIEKDPVGAQAFGLQPGSFELRVAPLVRYIDTASTEIENQARLAPKPRRGPKNGAATVIAQMVAAEYRKYFKAPPAISKAISKRGEATVDAPFVRMCGVVEEILHEVGHKGISLSDGARAAGIRASAQREVNARTGAEPPDE